MNSNQRITYTKSCLEFFQYKCVTPDDKDFRIYQGKHNNLPEMIDANFNDGFLNNWNWIMEVKQSIKNLGFRIGTLSNDIVTVSIYKDTLTQYESIESNCIVEVSHKNEKEAVVQAIDSFLKFYNKNLEMSK